MIRLMLALSAIGLMVTVLLTGGALLVGPALPDDGAITFLVRGNTPTCRVFRHLIDSNRNLHAQFCTLRQTGTGRVISPDGRYLAYEVNQNGEQNIDIHITDRETGTDFKMTDAQGAEIIESWSPSSRYLLYISNSPGYLGHIVDLSNQRRLSLNDATLISYDWSPDGRQIVYETRRGGQSTLFVRDLVTGAEQTIHFDRILGAEPAWSPDGSQIAFTSWRGARTSIDVFDFDMNNTRSWIHHRDFDDRMPVWSPDGRWLAYVSIDVLQQRVRVNIMGIETGDEQRVSRFWGMPFWSPDSRYLSFVNESSRAIITLDVARDVLETQRLPVEPSNIIGRAEWMTSDQVTNILLQIEAQ